MYKEKENNKRRRIESPHEEENNENEKPSNQRTINNKRKRIDNASRIILKGLSSQIKEMINNSYYNLVMYQ